MNEAFDRLVEQEREKRERNWDPKMRWEVIQQTIRWVAEQPNVRRNTKEACWQIKRDCWPSLRHLRLIRVQVSESRLTLQREEFPSRSPRSI